MRPHNNPSKKVPTNPQPPSTPAATHHLALADVGGRCKGQPSQFGAAKMELESFIFILKMDQNI